MKALKIRCGLIRSSAARKRRRRQDVLKARAVNARYQLGRMCFPGSIRNQAAAALANQLYRLACLDGQFWNGREWEHGLTAPTRIQ